MNLLIIGSGGHGRTCLDIARCMHIYDSINFLDDNSAITEIHDANVLGSIHELSSFDKQTHEVFIAIGNNTTRKTLSKFVRQSGYTLATLIHPSSCISEYATIKMGSVIFPHACIENDTTIGEGCILCSNVVVNHDATIENYCLIYANTTIRTMAYIEEGVRIESNCCIQVQARVKANSEVTHQKIKT